jgi:hypothetical protein
MNCWDSNVFSLTCFLVYFLGFVVFYLFSAFFFLLILRLHDFHLSFFYYQKINLFSTLNAYIGNTLVKYVARISGENKLVEFYHLS